MFNLKITPLKHVTLILIACTLFECDANMHSNNRTASQKKDIPVQLHSNQVKDEITEPCAIVISPTDTKIDSLKKANGDDFYVVADDNLFYIGLARQLLDSLKTKTIDKEATGLLTFKQQNGAYTTIDLSAFYWGIILFNGRDEPLESYITNFESEYTKYMTP